MLTDYEKMQVAKHLGYTSNTLQAGIGLGYPAVIQVMYPVLGALNHLNPIMEGDVRQVVDVLDNIWRLQAKLLTDEIMSVEKADEVTIRKDYPQVLQNEYRRWQGRLADVCAIEVNPMSQAQGSLNVRVSH